MTMELFRHVFMHTVEETLELLPFLFLTYLLMEYLEHRAGERTVSLLRKAGKAGPILGGLFGVLPQCGFSAAAANLYAGRVITVGTMVAVFLSTSDEMLPILISGKAGWLEILSVLAMKMLVGMIAGLCWDQVAKKQEQEQHHHHHIHSLCEREHCDCEKEGILRASVRHCLKISGFIFLVIFLLHFLTEWSNMEAFVERTAEHSYLSILLVSLLGLVPNCVVSVVITTLYLEKSISLGCMFAGLLSSAGVGLLVLFKMNRNWKENVKITAGIYGIAVACGMLLELLGKSGLPYFHP